MYTHVCTCELFEFNSPPNSVATCKERFRTERNIVAINLISNKIAAQPEIQANLAIFFLENSSDFSSTWRQVSDFPFTQEQVAELNR